MPLGVDRGDTRENLVFSASFPQGGKNLDSCSCIPCQEDPNTC